MWMVLLDKMQIHMVGFSLKHSCLPTTQTTQCFNSENHGLIMTIIRISNPKLIIS